MGEKTIQVKHAGKPAFVILSRSVLEDERLSQNAVCTYLALLSFANWTTKECYPSQSMLAKYAHSSVRSVQRGIDELAKLGYVTEIAERVGENGARLSNLYIVHDPLYGEDVQNPTNEEPTRQNDIPPASNWRDPLRQNDVPPTPNWRTNNNNINNNHINNNMCCGNSDELPTQQDAPPVKQKKPALPSTEAMNLAEKMITLHRHIDPLFLADKKKERSSIIQWGREIERIHTVDGRAYDEIERVIEWAKKDSFWRTSCVTAYTLRAKYSMLYAKMVSSKGRVYSSADQGIGENDPNEIERFMNFLNS